MGIYEELLGEYTTRVAAALVATPGTSPAAPAFSSPATGNVEIDPGTLYGVQSIDQVTRPGVWRISRREAMAVPAVKRGCDIITRVGQTPLQMLDSSNRATYRSFLAQPEVGIPAAITWSRVVKDLILYDAAWFAVTAVGFDGRVASGVRLDPETVAVPQHTRTFRTATGSGTAQVYDPDPFLIRIDSPTDPLLVAGARAIRALGRLELAALRAAEGVPPQDWFTPKDATAEPDDDSVQELLDTWLQARQTRATAYVPGALDYNQSEVDAEKAQLADARQHGVLEVARLMGIDPEDLGVSTTTRTYQNGQDRRLDRLTYTLGQYRSAIESRLSMDDITPRGQTVAFLTSELTAADDYTAARTDEINSRSGVETLNEIRARKGRPVTDKPDPPAPATPQSDVRADLTPQEVIR